MKPNHHLIKALVTQHCGQYNTISIQRPYINYAGSLEGGVFLSQLLYWSERTNDPEGWFYKSFDDWDKEICVKRKKISALTTQFEAEGFLETKLKRTPNGTPVKHYRIKWDTFLDKFCLFLEKLNSDESSTCPNGQIDLACSEGQMDLAQRTNPTCPNGQIDLAERPDLLYTSLTNIAYNNTHIHKEADKKQQPSVRVEDFSFQEEEKPILVNRNEDPSEGSKQEQMPSQTSCGFSPTKEKPSDSMGDWFRAGKKQLCPYPLLIDEDLKELWVGEDLPRRAVWSAFHPALIAGVQDHLKKCPSDVASDRAAAIARISSAIKYREVALLIQWFESGKALTQTSLQPSENVPQSEVRNYVGGTMTKAEFEAYCEQRARDVA